MSALDGMHVAISISDAPDRERLGFPQSEIDRVLLSICMGLVSTASFEACGPS